MATAKKAEPTVEMNVYQKLFKARLDFLNANVGKTGKNMNLQFMYFELDDIVPVATKIFNEIGLIPIVNFGQDAATMEIINASKPEEIVDFVIPFKQMEPITSNAGKAVTNEMQALGSSITYVRRYLYMIALDICEHDAIDGEMIGRPEQPDAPVKKAPATVEQRQEVKQELTAPAENATPLQIKGLKKVLKELVTKDPTKEEFVTKLGVQTEAFTKITKADCEQVIMKVKQMLATEGEK